MKDEKKAVEWYEKAAAQGYASAQYNLGVCYEDGQGVAKDEKKRQLSGMRKQRSKEILMLNTLLGFALLMVRV